MQILFEDSNITICIKESGISSEDVPGAACVPAQLRQRWGDPHAYVGVVHRLDMGVSGVMVYARTRQAAAALSAQVAAHSFEKEYRCVCLNAPDPPSGRMQDYLFKDSRSRKVFPVRSGRRGAKEAVLDYETLALAPLPGAAGHTAAAGESAAASKYAAAAALPPAAVAAANGRTRSAQEHPAAGEPAAAGASIRSAKDCAPSASAAQAALCRVRLHTGRTHQIRVQFASRRHPLLGDGKYGSRIKCPIALQCGRIAFDHPRTGERMEFSVPMPGGWPWELFI